MLLRVRYWLSAPLQQWLLMMLLRKRCAAAAAAVTDSCSSPDGLLLLKVSCDHHHHCCWKNTTVVDARTYIHTHVHTVHVRRAVLLRTTPPIYIPSKRWPPQLLSNERLADSSVLRRVSWISVWISVEILYVVVSHYIGQVSLIDC